MQQFVDALTVGPWAKVSTLRLLRSVHYSDLYSDELDQVATNLDRLHATATVKPTTTG